MEGTCGGLLLQALFLKVEPSTDTTPRPGAIPWQNAELLDFHTETTATQTHGTVPVARRSRVPRGLCARAPRAALPARSLGSAGGCRSGPARRRRCTTAPTGSTRAVRLRSAGLRWTRLRSAGLTSGSSSSPVRGQKGVLSRGQTGRECHPLDRLAQMPGGFSLLPQL